MADSNTKDERVDNGEVSGAQLEAFKEYPV